jgi:tetratricopeptide (TPR) repeat protein/NAD-dependent SIR2 family protein deacetylase
MDAIQKILHDAELDDVPQGGLCIYAGAGISFLSGIPLVEDIKRYIVEKICDHPDDRQTLMSISMPFEAFMEVLFDNYQHKNQDSPNSDTKEPKTKQDIKMILSRAFTQVLADYFPDRHDPFFALFGPEGYTPNANHYFIARMLANGQVPFAVTTNFDVLIEKAYQEDTGQELAVFCSGEDFKANGKEPFLLKLHGTCRDTDTILTTIAKISETDAVSRCEKMIDYTFRSGPHAAVLVLGYRFADVFDIVPAISGLAGSVKKVINIQHVFDDAPPAIFPIGEKKSALGRFDGFQVEADTNRVVQYLSELYCCGTSSTSADQREQINIERVIGAWAVRLEEPHQRNFLCGSFMAYGGQHDKAVKYFRKCLDDKNLSKRKRIIVLKEIIQIAPAESEEEQAVLTTLIGKESAVEQAEGLLRDVTNLLMHGDATGALENCTKALDIAEQHGSDYLKANCYGSLSSVYNALFRYREAADAALRALSITEKMAALKVQTFRCTLYCQLISSYENLDMYAERDLYMTKAQELSQNLNIDDAMADIFFAIAKDIDLSDYNPLRVRKVINYLKKGYGFCQEKQSVRPILKDAGFAQLAMHIDSLYFVDKALIEPGELELAYEVIRDLNENNTLGKYNPEVVYDVAMCHNSLCLKVDREKEALRALLCAVERSNCTDLSDEKKKQYLGRLYNGLISGAQRVGVDVPLDSIKTPFSKAKEYFEEACQHMKERRLQQALIAIVKGFGIVSPDSAFRYVMPYSTYIKIRDLWNAVDEYYAEL